MINPLRSWQKFWLQSLLLVLFGYATFGRTFAYLFLGELVLVTGVLLFLLQPRFMLIFSNRILLLWGGFAFLGLLRTLPFLGQYQFAAVRDAVLYAYGVIAVLIVAFLNNSFQLSSALNTYRRFIRWFIPIIPVFLGIAQFAVGKLPHLPWAPEITMLALKAPDTGVHLGAAALFLLLFSDDRPRGGKADLPIYRILAFIGFGICATEIMVLSRGGFIAMMIPILIASLLRPKKVGWKVAALSIGLLVLSLAILESNVITVNVRGRSLNADTVTRNLDSLVGNSGGSGGQQDNKVWRLVWWHKIIDYTVFGPYFWTGKGFGVNLATSDGPPGIPSEDVRLRSPHNGHMTVLARLGVPGAVLWIALNLTFAISLLRSYSRSNRIRSSFWSNLYLWIFCYWLTLIINMSFDVYIEGPQGGIWFWAIIGFGTAAMRIQRNELRNAALQREAAASKSLAPQPALVAG